MRTRASWRVLLFALLFIPAVGQAQESVNNDEPAVAEAEEIQSPLDKGFGRRLPLLLRPMAWQKAGKEALKDTPAFIRDTSLIVRPRTFYLDREAIPGVNDRSAWALGGAISYRSGKIADVLSGGAEFFTSQRLYGPKDEDGTLLLDDGQEGYSVVGTVYGQIDYLGQRIQGGRIRLDLPYVNSQDNRMTPNTFEGYWIGRPKDISKKFQYAGGYIDKIKGRNDADFSYMSDAWGGEADGTKRGTVFGAARYNFLGENSLPIGIIDFYVPDVVNVLYAEADYSTKLFDVVGCKWSLQTSAHETVGSHDAGPDYSAAMWGSQAAFSYNNTALKFGFTDNDEGADLQSPWGSYPGYNSSIIEDFNRAGEWSWRAGLVYDFKGVGFDGLSAYANYIEGHDAVDPETKLSVPDRYEIDANIDYRFVEGPLANLWLRLRFADVHEQGVNAYQEYRVIVNYDLPVI